MSAQMVSVVGSGGTTTGDGTGLLRAENDMLGLEQRAHELAQETGGGGIPIRHPVKFVQASAAEDAQEHQKVTNPDEIDLMDADSGDEDKNGEPEHVQLVEKPVPEQVFGGLTAEKGEGLTSLGAKARLASLRK